MKYLNLLVVVVTLSAISAVVLWEAEQNTAPGPLHPVHAQVAGLAANDGCVRCHGAPGSDAMVTACGACHEPIQAQIDEGRGLHGALADVAHCGVCHVEHHGTEVAPVGEHAFARADVVDRATYDHRHVADFALAGAHAQLACVSCHEHSEVDVLPAGAARFLGLDQRCARCHDDVHDGTLGADCARCHGQTRRFAQVGEFRHRRFVLGGAHAELRCDACHEKGSPHEISALQGADPDLRGCADCHGTPHAPGGSALPIAMPAARQADCARCHETDTFARAFEVADHAAIGVPLEGAHASTSCARCHDAGRTRAPDPAQAMAQCTDCHGTPHGPGGTALPLAHATTTADDCARCHDPRQDFRRPFDPDAHAAVGVRLRGAHAAADCARCHTPERVAAAAAAPRSTMERCVDCHASPHRDAFAAAVIEASGVPEASCAVCHDDDHAGFATARLEPAAHAAAGFPLDVPHQDVGCVACHGEPGSSAFERRFPGRTADGCAACHDDPHNGQFDAGPTRGTCVACHARTHFQPSAFGRDRHAACGFALDGAHAAVACARCHTAASAASPVQFAGAPHACSACHEDPHLGAFDRVGLPASVAGRDGCARCHAVTGFRDLLPAFDHRGWTGYALDGAHAQADCADCHGRAARPDARGRTLGAAPTACAACHDDPHAGQFVRRDASSEQLGALANDCARCHRSTESFRDLAFDHDRDTRFKLDASHRALGCAACHRPVPTGDGREVVRYRPLGTKCTDCHGGKEVRR